MRLYWRRVAVLRSLGAWPSALFVMVTVIITCGFPSTATTTHAPTSTLTSTATSIAPTATKTSLPPFPATNVDGRAGDLQVHIGSVNCARFGFHYNNLVISDPSRQSYGGGDLNAVRNYLAKDPLFYNPFYTTRYAPGGAASATAGVLAEAAGGSACNTSITLTNTGPNSLSFQRMALRLRQAPRVNTYHYLLVNECPFLSPQAQQYCPHGGGSGPGPCSTYSVHFSLSGTGAAGSRIMQPFASADFNCPATPTIDKNGGTLSLELGFESSSPYIYDVQMELTQDAAGQSIYSLDPARTALVFTQPSQFSCVDISTGVVHPASLETSQGNFCV
jgi:hypothetical protein